MSTFFGRKKNGYGTWVHPRHHKNYQLDRHARGRLRHAIRRAKSEWVQRQMAEVNRDPAGKDCWEAVNRLKAGLTVTKPTTTTKIKRADGTTCENNAEAAARFAEHFGALYGLQPAFNSEVLNEVTQHTVQHDCACRPTPPEIEAAMA